MRNVCATLVCSLILIGALCGCDLTLGPVTKVKTVVVQPGTGIEILQNVTVRGHVMSKNADGSYDEIRQDIGGWVALHPNHWESVKDTITALREAYAEKIRVHKDTMTDSDRALLGINSTEAAK